LLINLLNLKRDQIETKIPDKENKTLFQSFYTYESEAGGWSLIELKKEGLIKKVW